MTWGIIKPVTTFRIAPNYKHNCVRISGFYPLVYMKLLLTVRLTDVAIALTLVLFCCKNNFS